MATATTPVSSASLKDCVSLLKPGVMTLVVFTSAVGMWLAPGGSELHPLIQLIVILSIACGSGAGGALNMWYDKDIDAIMRRTQSRPIPAGRIAAEDALVFGLTLAIFSVMLLGLATHFMAGALLAFAIFFYAGFYTQYLKRRTPQNIVIGGAAGAFPPLIGWIAATGDIGLQPLLLFLIIFLWTPPHFWALALYRHEDYRLAGVPMLPVTAGENATKRQILIYSIALVLTSMAPSLLGMQGLCYLAVSITLGGLFMRHAWRVYRGGTPSDAMKLFGYSILYLFLLFMGMLIDKFVITARLPIVF